jgi:Zn finger protein HypA/HybF involved in hydrogenase expression
MGDIDEKTWFEPAQEYERLCRRIWQFSLGLAGLFFAFMILLGIGSERLYTVLVFIFPILVFSSCVCILGCFITSINLINFRCPRCGERFARRVLWYYCKRCKHCGLDLSLTKACGISSQISVSPKRLLGDDL